MKDLLGYPVFRNQDIRRELLLIYDGELKVQLIAENDTHILLALSAFQFNCQKR